ncbi:hypothetical protein [Bacillus sp. TH13]|uniref:hypothetical protein n=1 Tax=Bacillus sp. TH13 TaxID=2796379 RepID=UPI001F5B4B02|nr:hypothetical protein [Bacillus sp. TH13]
MDLKNARNTLQGVLESGRMSVKAKEDIQSVINMMNEVLKRNEDRDKAVEMGLSQSYSAKYTERGVVNTMKFFCNHPKLYDIANDNLKKMQGMQEDILHALEFFDGKETDLMK